MNKIIGVVGLGLIGASMAKALKKYTNHKVVGYDINQEVLNKAIEDTSIDEIIDNTSINQCDMLIIALYPEDTEKFIRDNINVFKKGLVIIDCTGTKEQLCDRLAPLAYDNGIYFIGGHPMAGIEKSGYDNSFAELFEGATMILCKDDNTNIVALKAAELLFLQLGFDEVTITDAKEHDRNIAFTSQLAHVVSSAYIKSDTALKQKGFSAGSYKDLTRVARLNDVMWTQLFFSNKDNLQFEIREIIDHLIEYEEALKNNDKEKMQKLLRDGTIRKEQIG